MTGETEPTEADVLTSFRDSLTDVIAVLRNLKPYCESVDDLEIMLQLAIDNDGQLRMVLDKVVKKSKR